MSKVEKIELLEVFLTVIVFSLVVRIFPSGEPLVVDNNLFGFWGIPALFVLIRAFLEDLVSKGARPSAVAVGVLASVTNGVWAGLSLGSVLILNEWFANPDAGNYEPLLIATTLASAAVLHSYGRFAKLEKFLKRKA
ncbi:hypothetical protein C1S86_25390 [Vibrio parahaemolyticus]|uniref:hypothetical protein n=1 Tax=Vibrio parahaemolyticus TaxID=670 RepID=UPI000991D459|nr:hypothetical protein [Vibrio parahaemolyticus]OOQ67451.1 hypothetical protein BSR61_24400 [Vibrio parahaemolyticus]PMT73751.1 hypothetical protein C1S97_26070 [Vibrio parahaemolyticus]PMT78904.1 hypothetical protein C1S86_25390 [Vibrio parahaemolyticus]